MKNRRAWKVGVLESSHQASIHGIIGALERDAPLQLKWEKGGFLMSRGDYGRWMSVFREDDTGVQRSFDDLASALASENISRGRALKLAGASLLGAAGVGERCPGDSYVPK
jgi:hypothetical protein